MTSDLHARIDHLVVAAATLAEGTTVLENAAMEPEVTDLAECLNALGARIEGAGTSRIEVRGVDRLHGATHAVVADRIDRRRGLFFVTHDGESLPIRYFARGSGAGQLA